ncbi:MAG: HAMP domain-containing histidine kinase [Selenomonadaceae bacterium]|nr:HAMP domain-containing histidine kinase [Selenomonadaceae bacterium]
MSVIEKLKRKYNGFEISTKIALAYATFFALLLALINFVMWLGFMTALFAPAERAINYSMVEVASVLENLDDNTSDPFKNKLVAGVVLRVVTDDGKLIVNTDEKYPSIENFNSGIMRDPPIFTDADLKISEFKNALIYCGTMRFEPKDAQGATLYFFRTITSELKTFHRMEKILFGIDAVGLFLALVAGLWLSRKTLTPIKEMNKVAREIVFEKMDGRIPIGSANDELAELAKTLNEMLDRLQGGIDQQKDFVANTSHELGQPATVFLGYVNLLKDGGINDPELLNEAIEVIGKEANNLKNLLENISILSRSDRNRLNFSKEILDIDDIVFDIIRSAKVYVTTHEVKLTRNDPAKIFGNGAAVKQLIRALFENAIKYTPEGGSVKINSVVKGDKVFLSIADSGIGIAPEYRSKIFDRGFRVNKKSAVKGSGLGLAMAKAIADNHKIKISVESELGKGTTFTLEIPIDDGNHETT